MLTYFIGNGENGPGTSSISEWETTLINEPYSDGISTDWWYYNIFSTFFDLREKDMVGEIIIDIDETEWVDEEGIPTGESGYTITMTNLGGENDDNEGCDFTIEFLEDCSDPNIGPTTALQFAGFDAALLYPDPSVDYDNFQIYPVGQLVDGSKKENGE